MSFMMQASVQIISLKSIVLSECFFFFIPVTEVVEKLEKVEHLG